jgi:hypothetical protein|tara:strand:- start:353 stop:931 length:579 start_codon:yes stop_codon:yes gene_type:complete
MSLPVVLQRVKDLGYKVFDGAADYDLNIVGIRSKDKTVNTFNDLITISYKLRGQWHTRSWACTTDPGLYWLNNPGRTEGTAILCPGQYQGCYKLGKHRGSYTALTQSKPVRVFRDPDRDDEHDFDVSTQEGLFGINIHRANKSRRSAQVDRWSAGCQVFADPKDFAEFLKLCRKQVSVNGWDSFSYTLIEEW